MENVNAKVIILENSATFTAPVCPTTAMETAFVSMTLMLWPPGASATTHTLEAIVSVAHVPNVTYWGLKLAVEQMAVVILILNAIVKGGLGESYALIVHVTTIVIITVTV